MDHAQIVGLSFVHTPEDVRELAARLHEAGAQKMGILLKIETRAAFENLPRMATWPSKWASSAWLRCRRKFSGSAKSRTPR